MSKRAWGVIGRAEGPWKQDRLGGRSSVFWEIMTAPAVSSPHSCFYCLNWSCEQKPLRVDLTSQAVSVMAEALAVYKKPSYTLERQACLCPRWRCINMIVTSLAPVETSATLRLAFRATAPQQVACCSEYLPVLVASCFSNSGTIRSRVQNSCGLVGTCWSPSIRLQCSFTLKENRSPWQTGLSWRIERGCG